MISECCGTKTENWTSYLQRSDRVGIAEKQYEKLRKALALDYNWLYTQMSMNFHDILSVSGESAIDETILPFEGTSSHIVFLPRKPHDTGIRLYLQCFQLSTSAMPVCFTVIPDTEASALTLTQVLRKLTSFHPPDALVSVTADSFFSSIGWLESQPVPTLFSMSVNDIARLHPLFTHQLKYHEARVFSNGKTILSFWHDNSMLVCGTNRYEAKRIEEDRLETVNRTGFTPIMDKTQLKKLGELNLEALKAIARKMGESTGARILAILLANHLYPAN